MSKKATEFQKKEMSRMYRRKEIFKPLNTGWVDEHVACVREWVANIFFYCIVMSSALCHPSMSFRCSQQAVPAA